MERDLFCMRSRRRRKYYNSYLSRPAAAPVCWTRAVIRSGQPNRPPRDLVRVCVLTCRYKDDLHPYTRATRKPKTQYNRNRHQDNIINQSFIDREPENPKLICCCGSSESVFPHLSARNSE